MAGVPLAVLLLGDTGALRSWWPTTLS